MKTEKREFNTKEKMLQIAILKASHPELSTKELAKKFHTEAHKVRYALQVYGERAKLLGNTQLGNMAASRFIASAVDDVELLRGQLAYCLSQLETNPKMKIGPRIDHLYKAMRVRVYLQDVEIQSHIKSTDAELIAMIVRRFKPEATNDDIVKIYQEVYLQWKNSHS